MDIQLTDFENSCLIVLMALMVDVINFFNLNFIIPVSKSDENMDRAHQRDAILNQKFWFNKNFVQADNYWESKLHETDFLKSGDQVRAPEYEEFTILEILTGREGTDFPGIRPMITKFMEIKKYNKEHVSYINYMLDFLVARAKGLVPTGARFIRNIVEQMKEYKKDSIIPCCMLTRLTEFLISLNEET